MSNICHTLIYHVSVVIPREQKNHSVGLVACTVLLLRAPPAATAAACNRDSSQISAALMDSDSSQQDGLAG